MSDRFHSPGICDISRNRNGYPAQGLAFAYDFIECVATPRHEHKMRTVAGKFMYRGAAIAARSTGNDDRTPVHRNGLLFRHNADVAADLEHRELDLIETLDAMLRTG